jgi:hypothetical protein
MMSRMIRRTSSRDADGRFLETNKDKCFLLAFPSIRFGPPIARIQWKDLTGWMEQMVNHFKKCSVHSASSASILPARQRRSSSQSDFSSVHLSYPSTSLHLSFLSLNLLIFPEGRKQIAGNTGLCSCVLLTSLTAFSLLEELNISSKLSIPNRPLSTIEQP